MAVNSGSLAAPAAVGGPRVVRYSAHVTAPMQYTIDADRGFALVRVDGPLTVAAVEATLPKFLADPDFRPGLATVFDMTTADLHQLQPQTILAIQSINVRHAEQRGRARVALVAADDLRFGVSRMYEVLGPSPNLTVQVFRTLDEAIAWAASGH